MAHPQLLAQLIGRSLPPPPGESGAAHVSTEAAPVVPRAGEQPAESGGGAPCVHEFVAHPVFATHDLITDWVCRHCGAVGN
ncbi:MAG: hypothetical protein AB7P99_10515 [Vicinamibacterales bacterium]